MAFESYDLRSEMVDLIPALRAYARRLHRRPNDADDLVQETLFRALTNIDKFQRGTKLKSWLFRIMHNTFCTKFGMAKRETAGTAMCVSDQPTVGASQEWSIQMRELDRAFARLPFKFREALDIVVMQGESYEAAAARCHCPIGTIKSRVSRARLLLSEELGGPF